MGSIQQDLQDMLQSPLTKMKPSGYRGLPMDAVQPIRQLHAAVSNLLSKEVSDDEPQTDEPETDEPTPDVVQETLKSLMRTIDPKHPYLVDPKDDEDDVEGEEVSDKEQQKSNKANKPNKKAQTKKAKGKQPVVESGSSSAQPAPGKTSLLAAALYHALCLLLQEHAEVSVSRLALNRSLMRRKI